ncbi:protein henna-like [Lytechinus pictus]|uniref:protein henna-like n=1 Tax=Lytechinus pictus TaxID=7653 RepID=UPI0030B9B7E2
MDVCRTEGKAACSDKVRCADEDSGDLDELSVTNGQSSNIGEMTDLGYRDQALEVDPRCKDYKTTVPWFPRRMKELDEITNHNLNAEVDLQSDHPGFSDPVYRRRRNEIADMAYEYRHGDRIPRVSYTTSEKETWTKVFTKLCELYKDCACQEFVNNFSLLIENSIYQPDSVPQLEDVSNYLKERTGFTLRPGGGHLTARDYFAGLAFRVHHSTQYMRHHARPMYTPEPDVCHELLGHVPLYADPEFAQFAQEIGLLSLGASDEQIDKLSNLLWFTLEFGLCRQNGQVKAYGAGLLSSFGELVYCLTDEPEIRSFDPERSTATEYPVCKFQPIYYLADSFEDAKEKVRAWSKGIKRPFSVHYDPQTQAIKILDHDGNNQDKDH